MGESIYQGLTVGYVLALTQFVMVAVLGVWYLRKAARDFDPLAAQIVERGTRGEVARGDRFTREGATADPEVQA
jgi:hypothetical protein